MPTISFTAAQISGMDKKVCKSMLRDLDNMLDAATKAMLAARIAELEKPPEPTPFPKQAELTDAWEQWKYWGGEIKSLVEEARKGNHTYMVDPKEGVKGKRAARQPRESKGNGNVSRITVQTEDGQTFSSFRQAAEHIGLTAGLAAQKINDTSWRRYIKDPIVVQFADDDMFKGFRDNMKAGAAGKLPNWAGMENYTLISPDGETWKL